MRPSQSNRVSRIPALSTHQIGHQEDLQKRSANSYALVGDTAFSCHEIDRRGDHGAKTARMHRRSAQACDQEVRHESTQLDEKGRRYRQYGNGWVGEAWEVSHPQFLP